MRKIRKDFFKRLLYIGLGIIPILFVREQRGWEIYIGIAGFIFSMYHFSLIIALSQLIIDDFFPLKKYKETKAKSFDKFIYYFAMGLFFGGVVFAIFEISIIENTIDGMKLFWKAAFLGVGIALILTVILKKKYPSVYYESNRRYGVHIGIFVGFFLLVPGTASFINYSFYTGNENCRDYKIIRKAQA